MQIRDFLGSTEGLEWLGLSATGSVTKVHMLDYAAGHGLVTEALVHHFATAIGIDVSEAMVGQYRATAARLGLGEERMKGVRGDLLPEQPSPTEPPLEKHELWGFDLVACSMALHHIDDPQLAVLRLVGRLREGGRILITSWTPVDGSTRAQREYQDELDSMSQEERDAAEELQRSHQSRHTISRPDGFTQQELRDWLGAAGCEDVKWWIADELSPIPVVKKKAQLFCVVATKK